MNDWLIEINTYSTLINSVMTFLTIIVGIIAILQTRKIAKKEREISEAEIKRQKKQYEESLENQNKQFEIELKHREENERIHEQPYLVFVEAKISSESDERVTRIDILFTQLSHQQSWHKCLIFQAKITL
ncbi:MAG: hypothetical protein MR922_11315 [Lachnospiraceae bacterium]|nr:hypothetical protein [Lachnospiraceae bacterium]